MTTCRTIESQEVMTDADHEFLAYLIAELTHWFERQNIPPTLAKIAVRSWLSISDRRGEIGEDEIAEKVEAIWREEMKAAQPEQEKKL